MKNKWLFGAKENTDESTTEASVGSKGDQKILRELNSLSKKYNLKIITTTFFDTLNHTDLTHLVVSSAGIFVVNAEDYEGLAEVRISNSIMRTATFQFLVGGNDYTDLINDIRYRVRLAQEILSIENLENTLPIKGVLALPYAEWPLFGRDNKIGGILLKGDEIRSIFLELGKYSQEEVDKAYNLLSKALITN